MNQYFEEGETFLWVKDRDYRTDAMNQTNRMEVSLRILRETHRTANKQGLVAEDIYSRKKYFVKVLFCQDFDAIYVEKESKAQLYSPYIVRIYGGMLDEARKRFITLVEYIEESDLSDLMNQRGIAGDSWEEKMKKRHTIAMKFLYGMEYYLSIYAEDPIVHRDLKPENVMASPDGSLVKIVDFDWVHLHDSTHTVMLRREQKGTPGYADPKYWNSYICKPDMDMYAAGLVLFFLYTGHHHFHGNEEITRYMVGDEYAYTLKEMPGIDGELTRIIAKMIARDGERYTKIQDVISDMWRYLQGKQMEISLPELLKDPQEKEENVLRFSYQMGDVIYRPYLKNGRFLSIEYGRKQERSQNGRVSGHILSFYRVGEKVKAVILHEDCHPVEVKDPRYVSEGDRYVYAGTEIKILQIRA